MKKDYSELLKKLIKLDSKKLDRLFYELHEKEFTVIDCLQCGKCCTGLGPLLTDKDISRLSEYLKIKPSEFTQKFLMIDEDNDYVFKSMPCPFIAEDNFCTVYDSRPVACRDYPHTNRKNIRGILHLCIKNAETCPVVENIFEELEKRVSEGKLK